MGPQKPGGFYAWVSPLIYLSSNGLSLTGVVMVTAAAVLWLFLLPMLVRGDVENPYLGIPGFLILPGVFILGLVLIPAGMLVRRASLRRQGVSRENFPLMTLGSTELRRLLGFIVVTTFANMAIAGQWGYSAVSYMDSDTFCGQACHTVMKPEYTAYTHSPHARVACVDCHIGAGASWFVRSKLSGLPQVYHYLRGTYPRPIPSPVENLRPARETCERCHWPQRFSGDLFVVRNSYASDEQNSKSSTVLLMKVGGQTWRGTEGIHGAHLSSRGTVTYIATDQHRQTIPQVIYTASNGTTTVFNSSDAKVTPEQLARGERRTMDCMDCHNRPTHIFQTPDRAVNEAMDQGHVSPKLPFIKKQALETIQREYPDRDTATREIAASLRTFYQTKYPQADATLLKTAVDEIQAIYLQNIFPEMKVTWGTYPSNLGHMDSPGCFRCHDGSHTSSDGRTISNDCATCHDLLAVEEKKPKVLTELGITGTP